MSSDKNRQNITEFFVLSENERRYNAKRAAAPHTGAAALLSCFYPFRAFRKPFRRHFPARSYGVVAGYPMQTVMRFSRYGAEFGNKKSPHNNLNLTILSGMALVRVRYVAIES